MRYYVIDFETRSPVDIKKCGAHVYAAHPDTQVIMLAVIGELEQDARIWIAPQFRHLVPTEITDDELKNITYNTPALVAQNAPFERMVWRHRMQLLGYNDFPIDKFHCTQARGLMCGYPKGLDQMVNEWTHGKVLKDKEGHTLMMKLSKPKKFVKKERIKLGNQLGITPEQVADIQNEIYETLKVGNIPTRPDYKRYIIYHESEELYTRFAEYAKRDVLAEKALMTIPKLDERERKVWVFDQKINDRGVTIDKKACEDAMAIVDEYDKGLTEEAFKIANYQITSMKSSSSIIAWLKTRGVELSSVDKESVSYALAHKEMDADVRRFFEIRQSLSKSSIAKYQTMLNSTAIDGRARGMFIYHGAGTGRWAGALIQPQNLPRTSVSNMNSDITALVAQGKKYEYEIMEGDIALMGTRNLGLISNFWNDPKLLASDAIRSMLVPAKGNEFICADFSAIEGRGLAWFADEFEILEGYKKGLDMYKVAASGIYRIPYEEIDGGGKGTQRQVGKTSELALGYGGGVGAMLAFGALKLAPPYDELLKMFPPLSGESKHPDYEVLVNKWLSSIIKSWREARELTTKFWYGLVRASIEAMKSGKREVYDKISFKRVGRFLTMMLPSGRNLYYPEARLEEVEMPWIDNNTGLPTKKKLVTALTVEATRKAFVRRPLNHLILSENATQALCRDLLVDAMFRVEDAGYPVVMHVHDEILSEVPKGYGSLKEFEELMSVTPEWAKGFPIKAVGWRGFRYKK